MLTLARFSVGRVVLHLIAMAADREFRFHAAGIRREFGVVFPDGAIPSEEVQADLDNASALVASAGQ